MNKGFFSTYFFDAIGHHYADFKGKSSRKEFWLFVLCNFLIAIAVSMLGSLINPLVGAAISLLLGLALFIPTLALYVRRMHDIGKSGWWVLISMVPLVGAIWFLVLLCKKGESNGAKSKWNWLDTVIMVIVGLSFIALPVSSMLGHKASSSLFDSIEEGLEDFEIPGEDNAVSEENDELSDATTDDAECASAKTSNGKTYYIYDDPEFDYSEDLEYCFIVGTDKKWDVITARNGELGQRGDQTILLFDIPSKKEECIPLLSASQIFDKYSGICAINSTYITLYPSSEFRDILYFYLYLGPGYEYNFYGKVDAKTKQFSVFNGTLIGMINDGSYKGCFLKVDEDGAKVCRQSENCSGDEDEVEAIFDVSDYFDGKTNYDLGNNEEFDNTVIEWLEAQ